MKIRKYESTYGICKNFKNKYYLVIDGKGHHNLIYSSKSIALKKASQYAKRMHYNFADNEGNKTIFTFKSIGEVKELICNPTNQHEEKHYLPINNFETAILNIQKAVNDIFYENK